MSTPAVTSPPPLPSTGHTAAAAPPSLQRRAPAHIDITRRSGKALKVSRRRFHLKAGQTFVVEVWPPRPSVDVKIAAEPPLHTIVPASRIEGGPVPIYHAEFSGYLPPQIIPIPKTGKVHATVIDGLPDPCRVTIPITVWPGYSMYVLWWLLAFLSIVGLRWRRIVADGDSFSDTLHALGRDFPHLLGLLALGSVIVIPLRLLGWLVSLTEPDESND